MTVFMDKLCTISTVTYSKVDGSSKRSVSALYTSVPCNFEQSKKKLYNREYANDVGLPDYEVVIPITYSGVRANMQVELIDPILGSVGIYDIASVNASKSVGGHIDCITLLTEVRKGQ